MYVRNIEIKALSEITADRTKPRSCNGGNVYKTFQMWQKLNRKTCLSCWDYLEHDASTYMFIDM